MVGVAINLLIYMPLIGEGVAVARPVHAISLGQDRFEIPKDTVVPGDECWMFQPGEQVRCEARRDARGVYWFAVERIRRSV